MECLFCRSQYTKDASYPRTTFFNEKNFFYKECKSCGLVFLHPLPVAEDYDKMYPASYHQQYYFKEQKPDYSGFYELIEKSITERNLLDYGCGDGTFLRFFSERGYRCTGVEYDKKLVEVLRKEQPNVQFYSADEFWKTIPDTQFAAIYLGDVLEHIAMPDAFLHQLTERLSDRGLLVLQGPLENNAHLALGFRKLTSKFISAISPSRKACHVPYHIFFSNYHNQKKIFEQNGLRTLFYQVYETAWPFPDTFTFNPIHNFKALVAGASKIVSKVFPGKMGNRFIYVGVKNG
jgi:2-polyprenyl-3-methyl-5-hydroxy-6-metoxy-1,4-benzoquinol methylase